MTSYNDPDGGQESAAVVILEIALVIFLLFCACVIVGAATPGAVQWLQDLAFRIGG